MKSKLAFLNNYKKYIIPTLILLSGFLLISSVYAYFMDKKDINSGITIGNCNVIIEEEFTPPPKYEPGDIITKKPWVKNIGNVPCYIRIRADVSNGQIAKYVDIDFNSTEWSTKKDDGYYYYLGNNKNNGILAPEETSEALFTKLKISQDIPSDLILNFDVYVYAEAVQAEGFDTAEEAWLRYTPENI